MRTAIAGVTLAVCMLLVACQPSASLLKTRPDPGVRPSARWVNTHSASPRPTSAEETASVSRPASASASASAAAETTAQPSGPATGPAWFVAPLPAPIAKLPAPRPAQVLRGPRDLGVPVLMYHVIGEAPRGAADPDLYVTPKQFAEQLRYLSKAGYHAVTLRQVYDFWKGDATLPSKPVVISFDDGDVCHFTIAAPLMHELSWPGTLNLIVGRHKPRLKPKIVRALIAEGWEIDAHTMSHEDVPGLSAKGLRYEVADSRKALQKRYHVPVDFFCYPTGRFDDAAIKAVREAGYLGATSTRGGLARPEDMWTMHRVRVSGGHTKASFAALVEGAQ